MIYFNCDYTEGAHSKILEKLAETNMEQTIGYGMDEHCKNAAELIKKACGREDADVHFLVGGTQTNVTVIDASLRAHQGVICASSGHINVQIFVSLPKTAIAELSKTYKFEPMGTKDDIYDIIRICTSWATKEENVTALLADIERVLA